MSALETIVLTQNNIKAVCRICLEKKSHLFSFKDSVAIEGEKFDPTVIGDMLDKLALGQIHLEKGLPKKICTKCVSLLQAAYVFYLKMQQSTNILKIFMKTTSDGQYQIPQNVTNSTRPFVKDSIKPSTSSEKVIKATELSQNVLSQIQNQMLNKEVKIFNIVPQKGLGNARPTVEVKQQEIVAVNQPVGTENNMQRLQVLSKDALNKKVTDTILNHTEIVDQKVGDAPVKPEKEKCNIFDKGVKVAGRSVTPLYACPICEKELGTPNELKQHVHNHKGLKKYLKVPSLKENSKFRAKPRDTVSLYNHPQILHKCPHCTKEISGPNIGNHFNHHLKQGRFKCGQCGRIFRRINHLNVHRIQHLKELPYWCSVCEKGFVIKNTYHCHMLTHTVSVTQTPHECPYCFKRFANPQHLHRHKVIHTAKVMHHKKYGVIRCKINKLV